MTWCGRKPSVRGGGAGFALIEVSSRKEPLIKVVITLILILTSTRVALATPVAPPACASTTHVLGVPAETQIEFNTDCTEVHVLPLARWAGRVRATAELSPDLPAMCARLRVIHQEQDCVINEMVHAADEVAKSEDLVAAAKNLSSRLAQARQVLEQKMSELRALAAQPASIVHFTLVSGQAEAVAAIQSANPSMRVRAMPLLPLGSVAMRLVPRRSICNNCRQS